MAKKETWLSLLLRLSQEVDCLFDELIYQPWGSPLRLKSEEWNPELDLYETDDVFILEVDLPGVKEKEFTVAVEDGNLVLRGHRVYEQVTDQWSSHRHKRREGQFVRRIHLPTIVAHDEIHAVFNEGVLRMTLPKSTRERIAP